MTDLDPDELRRVSKTVADIYGDATVRLLELVKRRMARGIDEPGWAEAKLLEIAGLRADAAEVIAQLEVDAPPALRKAIEDAHQFGALAARETMAVTPTLNPVTNQRAVEALARETITRVTGTHGGILRSVDDMFRTIISEVSAPGVVSGSESTGVAVQRALNRFADSGITGFVDKAGRNWRLDTYAEMATRTSAGRAMIDGRIEQYVDDGREFVIVSDSPQECKLCRPFEGQGLSISGRGVGTAVGGIRILTSLDDARAAGFQHPNCTHDLRPIIPGLTKRFPSDATPTQDRLRSVEAAADREAARWARREAVALDDTARREARARRVAAERAAESARRQRR